MDRHTNTRSQVTRGWDAFWQGTGESCAYSSGGARHPAIGAFWNHFFGLFAVDDKARTMIDLASGNGAVVEIALNVFRDHPPDITCLDVSSAAIDNIERRFAGVHGLVNDASAIPLASGTFDIVTSQFGIEYAGMAAFGEAARLLAPGGRLAFLIHNREGSIHRECKTNLEAVTRLLETGFIKLASELLRAGFAAVQGADRLPYETAANGLAPAVQSVETILRQYGPGVADDTIARLYDDVARIHENLQRYDSAEVLSWLERLQVEIEAYAERMSSMCDCALDATAFEQVCSELGSGNVAIDRAGPLLVPDSKLPLAWTIMATGT